MDFIRFFLIMLVPGLIAAKVYGKIGCVDGEPRITTALIFDLFIFLINITGLYFFKGIYTMTALLTSFNCLSFTRRYGLLSIFIGILLAIMSGTLYRIFHICHIFKKRK
ncbi:hypothetical protein GCM10023142_00450 [Anaerocolumna aminovalerica]|uniref:Uncharacterized protein n=1 Tax=Anaerocolumna aminovalerica TaxID=1527 RepID=A0A1I5G456_9FIRM|nr:hypothetical protein [Anaerocolumna aminovalerica]MBU5331247.1 hypothetical protein [Anaerocolumna aminovalerica]SFO30686.1 hypothetical protein SAMN04489757_11747 [Anaerocolumna aminovalerica]